MPLSAVFETVLGFPLSFGAPLILTALLALPVLWWLLRVTPPLPRRNPPRFQPNRPIHAHHLTAIDEPNALSFLFILRDAARCRSRTPALFARRGKAATK